jgi:hypothetical protein
VSFLPVFSFDSFHNSWNATPGCCSTSPDEDFRSPSPPKFDTRKLDKVTSLLCPDERPPNPCSARLRIILQHVWEASATFFCRTLPFWMLGKSTMVEMALFPTRVRFFRFLCFTANISTRMPPGLFFHTRRIIYDPFPPFFRPSAFRHHFHKMPLLHPQVATRSSQPVPAVNATRFQAL